MTAAALMIGLALVTFVTVFAAGLKSSVAPAVDENFEGQIVIQNSDGFSPIPGGVAVVARRVPGVGLGLGGPLGRRRSWSARAPSRG